jgi:hypothetical protein
MRKRDSGVTCCYACNVVSSSTRFLSTVRKVSIGFLLVFSVQFFIVDARVKG